jgi:hypothetical protein
MSATDTDDGQDTVEVADERQGTARVVLRAVRAVALDGLPPATQRVVLEAMSGEPMMLWEAVCLRSGAVETAIRAFAGPSGEEGNMPGTYRAIPRASWGVSPLVIEPPLG